jgi:uncharacterized RDD family membrane protein YckC
MPRGWLLLLCAVLFVWQPLTFAVEVSSTLPSMGMRGAAGAIELGVHGLVAALSFAAGWALWQASPAGPMLATIAIVAAAAAGVQSLYWSVLPSNVFPSDRLPLSILIVTTSCGWVLYLRRSKRLRAVIAES